ncbi:MAG: galactokinase [Bacilli bacterium]|nr:galactokinase [Bacilli bacterium]
MNTKLLEAYKKSFNTKPLKYFSSPCRINLIGEHTDYNKGLALPAAISKYIQAVVGIRSDRKISLKSLEKSKVVTVDLDNISNKPENRWGNYPLGIFATLQKRGYKLPFGLDIIFYSNVPIASGLSSSASLLDLTAFIASIMYDIPLDKKEIALLAHQSETEFNGLLCGVMDEFAIALGKKDKCILLDCKDNSFTYEDISFQDLSLVVIVSNVRRSLIASPYNKRVEECNSALKIIQKQFDVASLSDIKVSDLPMCRKLIKDDVLYKRVRHIVNENQRVRDFVKASKSGDIRSMIHLLNESHESLRDDYEVTGEYLDYIHEISLKYGAFAERMTGAGFGGSSIALIKQRDFKSFKENLTRDYINKYHIKPTIFLADICDGLSVEDIK